MTSFPKIGEICWTRCKQWIYKYNVPKKGLHNSLYTHHMIKGTPGTGLISLNHLILFHKPKIPYVCSENIGYFISYQFQSHKSNHSNSLFLLKRSEKNVNLLFTICQVNYPIKYTIALNTVCLIRLS